jgi:hypothetical protein
VKPYVFGAGTDALTVTPGWEVNQANRMRGNAALQPYNLQCGAYSLKWSVPLHYPGE